MGNTIAGKPSSFHRGPEIKQVKLNNKSAEQIKSPNWQLALDKCSRGVEPWTTWFKSSKWSERDLNSGSARFQVQRPNHSATPPS